MNANTVTAIAAVVGVAIAYLGLDAWKKQLHGNKDHEIAWKYLQAVFKLRDAINKDVRNPFIDAGEFQLASEEFYGGKEKAEIEGAKNPKAKDIAVYAMRWKAVVKARSELNDAIIQAEIWWGDKVKGFEKPLYECTGTLFVNVRNHIYPDQGLSPDRKILYYEYDTHSDFDIKLNNSIKKLEDFIRPYLRGSDS